MNTTECVASNRFAETFGYPKGRAATKVRAYMTAYVQEFIRRAPFAVMATSDREGRCDASPKGGQPGFVRVLDEQHLLFPDVAGNKLFQSYQNLDANPYVGLVFFIPGVNDTVRVNGKVVIVDKQELDRRNIELSLYNPDDNAKHLQGIIIEVEESYGHCPRALKFSQLWDVQEIMANQAERPISDRPTNS
ncbi:MAG: pyridoxamine 5'-phosphate oxidase family protein [Nitrospinae bacterium]|nr:pyridoxamine 5'-phosphate oxidase family protein [Nitrospinota bacterium]